MNTNYNSLLRKNIINAELFIRKKGFKKSFYEYLIILIIILFVFFSGRFFSQTIGQLFLRDTKFNIIEFIFKFLPLIIFLYIWIRHKLKLKEILSVFGLYEINYKKTIKKMAIYFVIVSLLLILLTTIFMNPPMYISSKLAKIANDENFILLWKEPIKDVMNEYLHQIYKVALMEEILFRGYIQYFSFFLLLYFFRNVVKWKERPLKKYIASFTTFFIPIAISVTVFMLFHNSYFKEALQVSSSMYQITLLVYLIGAIVSSLIINRTGNLWLAIFFHAAWNALQFISTALVVANYQIIITFLNAAMINLGASPELAENVIQLIASIVS